MDCKHDIHSQSRNQRSPETLLPPDVTLERDSVDYEMLFFGTGDRENPKDTTVINRLYAVKDKNPPATLEESDLVDVTSDLLQDPNSTQAQKDAF